MHYYAVYLASDAAHCTTYSTITPAIQLFNYLNLQGASPVVLYVGLKGATQIKVVTNA